MSNMPSDARHCNNLKEHLVRRKSVNKGKSAAQFRRNVSHTKAANIKQGPSRGGIRL